MIAVMSTVSVILANRNDLDRLLMTVLSAVEELRGLDGEVVVVDNSDKARHGCVKKLLAGQIKDGTTRLLRNEHPSSAATMEMAAREAQGEFLFYVDSHCLIGRDTIRACLRFFRRHQHEPIGFVHPPIQWAHNSTAARKSICPFWLAHRVQIEAPCLQKDRPRSHDQNQQDDLRYDRRAGT